MKKVFILVLLVVISKVIFAQGNGNLSPLDKIIESEKRNNEWKLNAKSNPLTNNYDLKYHRMEWYIDPAVDSIKGCITSYFVVLTNGFNQINFDCSNSLVIDSVLFHNMKVSYSQQSGDLLQITLPYSIPLDSLDSVSVYYEGIPIATGFGSFVQTTHAGAPIIWTLSEPYGAQDWWPCKNGLVDKIDSIDVIVTTPQINRVASNGLLVEEIQSGNNKIYHWKHRHPIATYLIAIAVTNYDFYSDYVPFGNDSFEVLNYVYPEDDSLARAQTPDIINVIKLYDSLVIPYPFHDEKYGHAQFGWGGGMEHQTMSFVTSFGNELIAHECAHQWFGDRVTLGSWQDIWLNEGFAVFMESLSEKYLFPVAWNGLMKRYITNVCILPNGSVWVDDTTSVSRIFDGRLTYTKGSLLLRMLEWKLGDSLFFQGLRNYQNDPSLAYNYARTQDLQRNLEQTSGQDLNDFFNEWFYGQGYPSYQINWNQQGNTISLIVNQTTSDPSVSFYAMPIPIEFKGKDGDTVITFDHSYSGQTFTVDLDFYVEELIFDPGSWLISSDNIMIHAPQITILPNPFNDQFALYIQGIYSDGNISLTITDVLGNKVWSREGSMTDLTQNNYPQLSRGLYFLQITCNEFTEVKKIIKE
jgi:aminopeptidase N